MKKILSFFLVVLVSVSVWQIVANQISKETKQRAKDYAMKAKEYCKQNGYRTDYCFLVDRTFFTKAFGHIRKKHYLCPRVL
jgi:hypothetical protein